MKATLGIIGEMYNKLCECGNDMIKFKQVLDTDIKSINKYSYSLIYSLSVRRFEFDIKFLEKKRYIFSQELAKKIESQTLESMQCKIENEKKKVDNYLKNQCNVEWPYCINDYYFKNVNTIVTYYTLTSKSQFDIINDYFFKSCEINHNNDDINIDDNCLDIMVSRRPHYCIKIIEQINKSRNDSNNDIDNNNNNSSQKKLHSVLDDPEIHIISEDLFKDFEVKPYSHNSSDNATI